MGHSQADKAASRARILAAAAAQMRDGGLDSVSVGSVMRSAELTHGGFYNHFGSRAELLVAALAQALAESVRIRPPTAADEPDPDGFRRFVRAYLSRAHRDNQTDGCAIAALAGDVSRADTDSRAVMSNHIEALIGMVASALGEGQEAQALLAVSAMIGALQLSRVLTDPKQSDQMLKAVRDQLAALADAGGGSTATTRNHR